MFGMNNINSNVTRNTAYTFHTKVLPQTVLWKDDVYTDYIGYDMGTGVGISLKVAKTICANDTTCKGFTWNPNTNRAYYKNKLGAPIENNSLNSYTKLVFTSGISWIEQ